MTARNPWPTFRAWTIERAEGRAVFIEFVTHPDGAVEGVGDVRSTSRARGGLPFNLVRCRDGREFVVRGAKDAIDARLDVTGEGPALRIG